MVVDPEGPTLNIEACRTAGRSVYQQVDEGVPRFTHVRTGGFEPPRLSAPAPKAGASASSATSAWSEPTVPPPNDGEGSPASGAGSVHLPAPHDHLVNDSVLAGFVGGEPAVAVAVSLDGLHRLAGVLGDPLLEHLLGVGHLLGLDGDVGGLAPDAAQRLVHHDPGVGQGVALAGGAGAQQELAHRRAEAHADGAHLGAHELHGVVDGHARGHRPAGRVDVHPDRLVRVLGLEEQHLGDDEVGYIVVHVGAEEHDAVLEQPGVDVEAPVL